MKEYIENLKRNFLLILLVSAVLATAAFFTASRQGDTYEVHFSYLVSLQQREQAEEYRFDGFYALQATDLFATTLAGWIRTPEVAAAAYQVSGLDLQVDDPKQLLRTISAGKAAPQLVEVSVKHQDRQTAIALAESLQEVMDSNIERYHDKGIPALSFGVVATEFWVGKTGLSVPVIVAGVFVFTFLLGINFVLLLTSLKRVEA